MAKYEYKILPHAVEDEKKTEFRYNEVGSDGWELVAIDESNGFKKAVFKREIEGVL